MTRWHRRHHKPKPKRTLCIGCGHPTHGWICGRYDRARGRFRWCTCRNEQPLTKRKRKRYTGRRSRPCCGSGPRGYVTVSPEDRWTYRPPKEVARQERLYENILDDALNDK